MGILLRASLLTGLVCCMTPAILAQDDSGAQRRMRANEFSAVRSLRIINVACVTYSATYGIGYPSALGNLGTSGPPSRTAADLIDGALTAGEKDGYRFTYTPGAPLAGTVPDYNLRADPVSPGVTGERHYFTDSSGVIRGNDSAPATERDPPIDRAGDFKPHPSSEPPGGGQIEANEAWALADLRTLNTASITYAAIYGTGFPSALKDLGPSRTANAHAANLIDEALASGTKDGHVFAYTPGNLTRGIVPTYRITADPVSPGQTGRWHYFTDQSGVIRANLTGRASASDSVFPGRHDVSFGPGVAAPDHAADAPQAGSEGQNRIKLDRDAAQNKLVSQVAPAYPPLARQAKITGTVRLHAIIDTDGTIKTLEVVSGPPLLLQSALDAVRRWRYKPTLWQGRPAEVETIIEVVYTLDKNPN